MPRTDLDHTATLEVIAASELVRVAFRDGDTSYVLPFGYTWMDGCMYGVTDPGRKTELAAANPTVAFQIDTSLRSGLFEWDSVTGQGWFDIVEDPAERGRVLSSLQDFAASAPAWWRDEQVARAASGALLAWRLTPHSMTGARYAPEP